MVHRARPKRASARRRRANFFEKYDLADVLARGAYGAVYTAYDKESGEQIAVKIVELSGGDGYSNGPAVRQQLRSNLRAERAARGRIGFHPNTVMLRESFIGSALGCLAMELCTGSLFQAWASEPDLNENTYARYFREMLRALLHIHSVGVIHRDVKQDSFMVGAPYGRTVKLFGFGHSAVTGAGNLQSAQVGTAPYMAPEMVTRNVIRGFPVDVWSFGVIVYIAFFGCCPYQPEGHSTEAMKKVIREGTVKPTFAPEGRTRAASFIRRASPSRIIPSGRGSPLQRQWERIHCSISVGRLRPNREATAQTAAQAKPETTKRRRGLLPPAAKYEPV